MADDPESRITPYLLYEDVAVALDWLGRAFGLTPFGDVYRGADGRINHAAMRLGDGVVMMGCPGPDYQNPRKLGAVTQNLYVLVDDIDAHFERAKRAGAAIREALTDTFYGARRYGAEDPEGHVWYFAVHAKPAEPSPLERRATKRAGKRAVRRPVKTRGKSANPRKKATKKRRKA